MTAKVMQPVQQLAFKMAGKGVMASERIRQFTDDLATPVPVLLYERFVLVQRHSQLGKSESIHTVINQKQDYGVAGFHEMPCGFVRDQEFPQAALIAEVSTGRACGYGNEMLVTKAVDYFCIRTGRRGAAFKSGITETLEG